MIRVNELVIGTAIDRSTGNELKYSVKIQVSYTQKQSFVSYNYLQMQASGSKQQIHIGLARKELYTVKTK